MHLFVLMTQNLELLLPIGKLLERGHFLVPVQQTCAHEAAASLPSSTNSCMKGRRSMFSCPSVGQLMPSACCFPLTRTGRSVAEQTRNSEFLCVAETSFRTLQMHHSPQLFFFSDLKTVTQIFIRVIYSWEQLNEVDWCF